MRDSADSGDYGVTRRGSKRGQFRYEEATYQKRDRRRPRLQAEDKNDATDGLPEGDRWSTWDQTENLISNAGVYGSVRALGIVGQRLSGELSPERRCGATP